MTLVWKTGYSFDSDASTYIDAVETADGLALETGVRVAINDFVLGCKQDEIWDAIKASCILAGARTTNGALVPLVGTAPTPNNFDLVGDTDYNRKTGLKGDGSTKYLDSNRNNNADPQNSNHNAVYVSAAPTSAVTSHVYMGVGPVTNETGANNIIYTFTASARHAFRNRSDGSDNINSSPATGLIGASRDNSANYTYRFSGSSTVAPKASQTPRSADVIVFSNEGNNYPTDARLAFYSIGESLDLTALDTRVSNLITAIGAAIP